MTSARATVHVCIATGQNAANLIPLRQMGASEVWILQTPAMRAGAANLKTALGSAVTAVRRVDFDDASPASIAEAAQRVAEMLDGRDVVLHATGGTKLMVLALRDALRLVETGGGRLEILYAETARQRIDWLGADPRTEPMGDVLDLRDMLLVQGYRIDGDNRHAQVQMRAQGRSSLTKELGDNAARHASYLGTLNWLASKAREAPQARDRVQQLQYAPVGSFADLLQRARELGLVRWSGDETIEFVDQDAAAYLSGGWLEEYVLLKLTGLCRPGRFSANLKIERADKPDVSNEIDAMVVHRNRALLIECKTGTQEPQNAIYKLAQLRDRLGGSVASALYLHARRDKVPEQALERAREYGVDTLVGPELGQLAGWLRRWLERG